MTRPIYEPSLQRTDRRLTYTGDQLLRRPAPSGESAWPWITLINQGQGLASSGAFTPSYFTDAYWDPAITPDPQVASFDDPFEINIVSDAGNDYWELLFRVEGWYMIEMVHTVDDTGNGGAGKFFQQTLNQASGAPILGDNVIGAFGAWDGTGGSHMDIMSWLEDFRMIWREGDPQIYQARIRQNTGVEKSVGGHLKVWYLAGVGGSTDDNDWDSAFV